jgi:hypothetical protein
VTRDGGATWSEVSPTGLPEHAIVNAIEPSAHDPNTAFAAVLARRDTHPYFFRTTDGGKTWEKIITGLPDAGIARVIREDPVRKGMLFAGTETGVYLSFDCGDHWQSLQLSLPTASYRDLTIHGNDLIAATFGRGLWILDDISPLRQWNATLPQTPVNFFTPELAIRTHWDNHPDTPLQRDMPVSQNASDGAMLYYFLAAPPKGEITLDVLDERGARVRHFSSTPEKESLPPANVPEYWFYPPTSLPTAAGLNRFVWDLRYPNPTALPFGFFGERLEYTEYTLPDHAVPGETPRFQPPGPLVSPGTYDLVLTVEGKSYRQKLRVTPDPRVHISPADYAAQFSVSEKLAELMNLSATSFYALDPLDAQLAERKKLLPSTAPKELLDALANVEKQLDSLEAGTDQTPGFGTINRDAARYLEMVQAADVAPTASVRSLYASSCEAYGKSVASENKFTNELLPTLNKQLEAQKLTPISLTLSSIPGPSCAP